MLTEGGLQRVLGISQLFIKRDKQGRICLLIAKVTDDFLLGGSVESMEAFIRDLKKRFIVGKIIVNAKPHFDGCEIEQYADKSIRMSMIRYLERLKPITISRTRRKQRNERATEAEIKQYRSLDCTLMYLGNGVLPHARYVTSALQQQVSRVFVEQLVSANEMQKELMALNAWVTFKSPIAMAGKIQEVFVSTFTDASFNQTSSIGYGQSGILTGLRIELQDNLSLSHPLDWSSHKQRRVSSPYGAEVLASADADDRGYYFKMGLTSMFPHMNIHSELLTDSRCLYDTITTLHEGKDFRLRPTVQRMRNSFDSCELDFMRWIAGTINPADALTKRNPDTTRLLNKLVARGILCIDLESGYSRNSKTWQ